MKVLLIALSTFVCLVSASPSKGQSNDLKGTLNCQTGKVRLSKSFLKRTTYPDWASAAIALKDKGFYGEGFDNLSAIFEATCKGDFDRPIGDLANTFEERMTPLTGTLAQSRAEALWLTLTKKFRIISFEVEESSNVGVTEMVANATNKKRCRKITDKPYCIKCPSGTIHCPIKNVKG
jgi:hypothetical protein